MTQDSPDHPPVDGCAVHLECERGKQVHDDVVIVAGVKTDVSSRFGHCPYHVDGLITVEWSDLDGDDIIDVREIAPETVRENAPSDRRLQIEANDRQNICDCS